MCSFLNRNRDFIDVTQCSRLQGDEYRNNIPTNVLLPMEDDSDYLDISAEWENVMTTCFSESVEFEEVSFLDEESGGFRHWNLTVV
ncbi:hypothetical protein DVH05_006774 [Phytophthora capsici]|nr:hypothetical protein DVH05_006774 [Phytophthora capsici]